MVVIGDSHLSVIASLGFSFFYSFITDNVKVSSYSVTLEHIISVSLLSLFIKSLLETKKG